MLSAQGMQVWKGWIATGDTPEVLAPNWDEWLAQLQLDQQPGDQIQEGLPRRQDTQFTERELRRLTFVRWLYLTGRLDPMDPRAHESA
jgi:hypothetical protein